MLTLGIGEAPLHLAEGEARNLALQASKSLGIGEAPLRLAEGEARNLALQASKIL